VFIYNSNIKILKNEGKIIMKSKLVKIFILMGVFDLLIVTEKAFCQNSTTPGNMILERTFNCISVIVSYSGDDNQNNGVILSFKRNNGSDYLPAHDMVKISGKRWAGSIVNLESGTEYEVKVEFYDPDGVDGLATLTGRITTRIDALPTGAGITYHVSAISGSDSNDGSESRPWATLQKAADNAMAGDTVIVHEGIYREEVEIKNSGEEGAPITFVVAEGEHAIIDGSIESLSIPGGNEWINYSGSIWYVELDSPTGFVAEDGRRLYHYENSLSDLETLSEGYSGGWYYDDSSKRLYVRTREDDNPDNHEMQVGRFDNGFIVDGLHDIVIEGFEIRFQGSSAYGKGVYIRHSSNVWVRKCLIHSSNGGVSIRFDDSNDNVIEWNEIYDNEITSWDWEDVKGHDAENSAISVEGGSGNVVRINVIYGFFNGIALSLWDDLENESYNHNVDVYSNYLYDIGDDGIEPEGACINMRIWGNIMDRHHNCISLAPITVGPLFAWRNVMSNFKAGSFKVSVDSRGPCFLYNNTAYTARPDTNAFTPSGPYGNMTFRNNIFISTRYVIEDMGENTGGVTWDYDNLFTSDPDRFVKWEDVRYSDIESFRTGTNFEIHGISSRSLFANEGQLDFHLLDGSPEIDKGVLIPNFNDVYCGSAPDIGAFEFSTEGCTPQNPEPVYEPYGENQFEELFPEYFSDVLVDGISEFPEDIFVDSQHAAGEGCGCFIAG